MEERFLDGRVLVKVGDITGEHVDAIVNAANYTLLGGAGVDGAIHRRGGPAILAECKLIREYVHPYGLGTGKAVITAGGDLPVKHVIHTVGPIYGQHSGYEPEMLRLCYMNSLSLAVENSVSTIAFPAISTGAYGYPKPNAAAVASLAVKQFLAETSAISEVRFVFFTHADLDVFVKHNLF